MGSEVRTAQSTWADPVQEASPTFLQGNNHVSADAMAAGTVNCHGRAGVLIKATKGTEIQLRLIAANATCPTLLAM